MDKLNCDKLLIQLDTLQQLKRNKLKKKKKKKKNKLSIDAKE